MAQTKHLGWFALIRMFQIEIFAFIFTFSASVEDVTVQLVAQDKICMKRLNSTRICANLSSISPGKHSDVLLMIKDEVLVQVTMFNFYQTLIYTIPLLFTSLFLSSWADRHRKSAKILLCLSSFMFLMESVLVFFNVINFHWDVYLMLIPFAFFPMVGGAQVVAMTIIGYLTITTKPEKRIKRFAILELITIVSNPLAVFVGGQLIRSDATLSPWARSNGQLHNYHYVIMVGLVGKALAFLYALLTKFKKRAKTPGLKPKETDPLLLKLRKKRKKTRVYRVFKYARSITDIFVIRNISESFEVCCRRRKQQVHLFIWLLLIAMTLFSMTQQSLRVLLFQFVQKVYYWDASTYSTYNAILYITTHMFGLMVVTPLLTEVFHLSDSTLLMVGLLSVMAQNFIRGTIIDVAAFCSSYFFGAVTALVSVSIRTKLSKLISADEQYRLFGILTMLETISPMLGISIFTQIFNQTISTYPGFVYQFSCFILLAPIIIASYININLPQTTNHSEKNKPIIKSSNLEDNDDDDYDLAEEQDIDIDHDHDGNQGVNDDDVEDIVIDVDVDIIDDDDDDDDDNDENEDGDNGSQPLVQLANYQKKQNQSAKYRRHRSNYGINGKADDNDGIGTIDSPVVLFTNITGMDNNENEQDNKKVIFLSGPS